jgi:hypothetical protein
MAEDKKEQPEAIRLDFLKGDAKKAADSGALAARTAEQERCDRIADQVNAELSRIPRFNIMQKCKGELEFPHCAPLELPRIKPLTFVLWGDSRCDCIEGDDTEIMSLVVCNPYSNLILSHFTINRIEVVQDNGQPVPLLPDGSPSIQLVPLGPYCFDDIAPCTCVWRQFVLRLRGAPPGRYRILLQGICFEACIHQLQDDCVAFNVCKD